MAGRTWAEIGTVEAVIVGKREHEYKSGLVIFVISNIIHNNLNEKSLKDPDLQDNVWRCNFQWLNHCNIKRAKHETGST